MSERTLVGSFEYGPTLASGGMTQNEHTIFAFESGDQTKSWKIKEIQVWLNPFVESGGDTRGLLSYCLTTDFLTPPDSANPTAMRIYAEQFYASDNRGIAWGFLDFHNRDATVNDFRIPAQGIIPHGMIADGRRAINYLILNCMISSESSAIDDNVVNYRIVMEEIKVTPTESIMHQVRGLAQDVN